MSELEEVPLRPCVGCGYCCRKVVCPVGHVSEPGGECDHLLWSVADRRYYCELVRYPMSIAEGAAIARSVLAIGAGCCSPLFNTDRDAMLRGRRLPMLPERCPVCLRPPDLLQFQAQLAMRVLLGPRDPEQSIRQGRCPWCGQVSDDPHFPDPEAMLTRFRVAVTAPLTPVVR